MVHVEAQKSANANQNTYLSEMVNLDQINTRSPTTSNIDLSSLPACLRNEGDGSQRQDFFQGVFEYLNQMLMEEDDLVNKPCMLTNSLALQAAEQSFYDVLVDNRPPTPDTQPPLLQNHNTDHQGSSHDSSHGSNHISTSYLEEPSVHFQPISSNPLSYCLESDPTHNQPELQPIFTESLLYNSHFPLILNSLVPFPNNFYNMPPVNYIPSQTVQQSSRYQENMTHFLPIDNCMNNNDVPNEDTFRWVLQDNSIGRSHAPNRLSGKRNLNEEGGSILEESPSCNKQVACCSEDILQLIDKFDRMLLCDDMNPQWKDEPCVPSFPDDPKRKLDQRASSGGKACGKKKAASKTKFVDLRSLLLQCSQAIANSNINVADELLKEIRLHSSPYGDSIQRLAHYFANAIEGRLAGTGTSLYKAFSSTKISAAQMLKSYEAYMRACPFHKMSNIFANKSIGILALGKDKLHIIDFGILYGFQWPCIIQGLSLFPGGPPKLRITGIDLPQPGLRPAERVEETGRHLANFCKRFNVPFEYNAIAKKWDDIQIEDLKIDKDEVLVVNSIYRLRSVPDETVVESRPRDKVLNLIKKIKPDLFMHGVLNGTYGGPFFLTRFREALFHFSTLFDMFEVTATREDKDRFLFEQEVFGRDVMNVIACEGTSRVERPESYKKWQARNVSAGFKQLPLDQDFVQEVRAKVKLYYHKDFLVDEDSNWLLQGWKGRVLYAISLWKPAKK